MPSSDWQKLFATSDFIDHEWAYVLFPTIDIIEYARIEEIWVF